MDTGSLNLMLNVWNDSRGLPNWVIDGGKWMSNPTSWNWSNWVNADSWSTSWLWALACGNDSVGKIISQWDIISSWLVVEWVVKIWLAFVSREEVAPVSAVRKLNPSSSNSRLRLSGRGGSNLDE